MKNAVLIIAQIDLKDGRAPEWILLLKEGWNQIADGQKFLVDREGYNLMAQHISWRGIDPVFDYEHQTLKDVKAPASGWWKTQKYIDGTGIMVQVDWTAEASALIAKKEYRYFSPVIFVRKSDQRIVAVHSVALTNAPKINHLAPLLNKLGQNINQKEERMWEKLKKLLGLADDAGEDKTVEAVQVLVTKNIDLQKIADAKPDEVVACKEVLEVLKLTEAADKTTVIAAISGLGATGDVAKELSLQVAKLTTEIAGMKQSDLVAEALKNGQTSPEELGKWGRDLALKSPEQFKVIVLSRPKGSVVPIDKIGDPPPKKGDAPDDVQLEINKMMGVDDEAWKKYGPKEAD